MSSPQAYDVVSHAYDSAELFIRRLDELHAQREILARRVYFDGGDVLACQAGHFRFSFDDDNGSIDLLPGSVLVIYPGNTVTIESFARGGTLRYAIFGGTRVADFFDSYGFYDHLLFSGDMQETTFDRALQTSTTDIGKALGLLCDALTTFGKCLQAGERSRLHRTMAAIHRNVRNGKPRIKLICDEIGINRSTLNRIFFENDLGTPSDYIHLLQFRRALRLLRTTELPIRDIAQHVGIPSPVYFTEFIRRHAGMPPSRLRMSQPPT